MFGRERNGLENHEVALADRIITLPVNPAFASLNLAQAVADRRLRVVQADDRRRAAVRVCRGNPTPRRASSCSAFFENLEHELEKVEFFRPPDKRDTMQINLRNIFSRMQPTQQDIQTLHGVIMAIAEGRKGPARGGVLDSDEAGALRALLAEHGGGDRCRASATGARPRAAAAAQSDRRRARPVGRHRRRTAASPASASSGRRRSARTSRISCRSRCGS